MNIEKMKTVLALVVGMAVVFTMSLTAFALEDLALETNDIEEYDVSTLDDFKTELEDVQEDGKVTNKSAIIF